MRDEVRVVGMDTLSGYCKGGGFVADLYLPSPLRVDTMSQDQDQMLSVNKTIVKLVETLSFPIHHLLESNVQYFPSNAIDSLIKSRVD